LNGTNGKRMSHINDVTAFELGMVTVNWNSGATRIQR